MIIKSHENFRIVQIIDSLDPGGAERIAVSYANSLSKEISFSGLIATRKEGGLKSSITNSNNYLFVDKKKVIDFKAIKKTCNYLKLNKINIIHAHSSSCYFAIILKVIYPKIKIIWHDHYGNSDFLINRNKKVLIFVSYFFDGIISVNQNLKIWAKNNLNCKEVVYLPNYTPDSKINDSKLTKLKGEDRKRIICLANLREQKDHFLLLEVAILLKNNNPGWTIHLVGKDFGDEYSLNLKNKIKILGLSESVFLYDTRIDIDYILSQCEIGVLTSKSEGLPVSLLEYGRQKLAVVSTKVGEIPNVIEHEKDGFLIDYPDYKCFYKSVNELISDEKIRNRFSDSFFKKIENQFSESSVMQKYLNWTLKINSAYVK